MAECDERSWLAALSLMNSLERKLTTVPMKPSLWLTCPINGLSGQVPFKCTNSRLHVQ
jgi:hypothetical protein